jgi:hypothetical protein
MQHLQKIGGRGRGYGWLTRNSLVDYSRRRVRSRSQPPSLGRPRPYSRSPEEFRLCAPPAAAAADGSSPASLKTGWDSRCSSPCQSPDVRRRNRQAAWRNTARPALRSSPPRESNRELFARAAIIADISPLHRSTSVVHFCQPMDCIQNLVRRTEGFHRRHSCAFGPSRHKLPRSIRSCEPPQPSGEFHGSCEWGL